MGRYNSCLQISKRTSCAWQSAPVLCWIQGQDKSRLVKIKRKEVEAAYEEWFPDGKSCQAKEHWLEQRWITSSWKLSYWCWRVICQGWFSMNKRFENMTNKSSSSSYILLFYKARKMESLPVQKPIAATTLFFFSTWNRTVFSTTLKAAN